MAFPRNSERFAFYDDRLQRIVTARRGVALILDGLCTEAAHPLPVGPLTQEQLNQVLGGLTSTP
ncbi:hypothetical protein [Nonomuraea sp. NPDC049480]|uniref:hypothetical protein n=1 Tax=Nonomuraea sp. NPDC049480 TaxID=3364353 RepID=UPI003789367D